MRSDLPEDNNLEVALDAFWNVAYQQGQEQRGHDDEEGTAQKVEDDLRSAIAAIAASRIRSCLLDKPEAVEGDAGEVPTGVLNDMLLARAPDCRWTIASILKQHGLNYRQRLDYMRAALVASRATVPADTDAAQMQEVALARATAREDLFPEMSSRIKAEREQARRKALEEAAEIAEHAVYGWKGRNIAAAIRQRAEEE
ncbi:hypothetical protein I7G59_06265 [Sinorhizobium meliloti]|uniref:hypothetical protein n=1 Tax=Rhizobium meliloti TaxID=382 RepID=UPI002380012C|nr:hypothetical protein [Sinorhizobium meliloti]MDE3796937.1 hypothetical protein [Sinorhizobium meliloti]